VRDHVEPMSEKPPSEVLSALPRTRPHRRSEKRGGKRAGEGNGAPPEPTADDAVQAAEAPPADEPVQTAEAPPAAKPKRARPAKPKTHAAADEAPARARGATGDVPARTRGARAPRTRPKPRAERLRQPPQPGGTPPTPRSRKPVPATGADMVGTAIQAAAELAEIGLTVSARALRNAVSRLPRP
jgi:hypothetical protein